MKIKVVMFLSILVFISIKETQCRYLFVRDLIITHMNQGGKKNFDGNNIC